MFVLEFYHDNTKTFCRVFSAIENLHITLYRYDVGENRDVGERMSVLYSLQLYNANLGGIVFSTLNLFPLRGQLQYWRKFSESSMDFSDSL